MSALTLISPSTDDSGPTDQRTETAVHDSNACGVLVC